MQLWNALQVERRALKTWWMSFLSIEIFFSWAPLVIFLTQLLKEDLQRIWMGGGSHAHLWRYEKISGCLYFWEGSAKMYPNSRVALNRAPNLRWQAFLCYYWFSIIWFTAPYIYYHLHFLPQLLSHYLSRPTAAIISYPRSSPKYQSEAKGRTRGFSLLPVMEKSGGGCFLVFLTVAFFSFLYLLLQLTPTKLCSQLRHQIERHVAKGHR